MLSNVKLINRFAYLTGGLAIFILLLSLIEYGVNNWFLINRIIITGKIKHVSAKQVSYIAENRLQGNLLTLDIDSLQEEFRQIPWVKDVTVSREFPDSITIELSEYDAIARLNNEALITQDGQVFDGADDSIGLPTFDVPLKNVHEAISDYHQIEPILALRKLQVSKLDINGVGITKIEFSNGLHVTICGSEFAKQIELLDQYWDKLYSINAGLSYINMCYKNAFAINAITAIKDPASVPIIGTLQSKEIK